MYQQPMLIRIDGRAAVVVGLVMETRGGHDAMPACERCETAAREAVAGERKPGPIIEWRTYSVRASFAERFAGIARRVDGIRTGRCSPQRRA